MDVALLIVLILLIVFLFCLWNKNYEGYAGTGGFGVISGLAYNNPVAVQLTNRNTNTDFETIPGPVLF